MDRMVCFNPEDVIFLLNKWDAISHEDDDQLEEFFQNAKTYLRKLWKEVEDSCIFKISAVKVSKFNITGLNEAKFLEKWPSLIRLFFFSFYKDK